MYNQQKPFMLITECIYNILIYLLKHLFTVSTVLKLPQFHIFGKAEK